MAGGNDLAVKVLLQDGDMTWRKGRERYMIPILRNEDKSTNIPFHDSYITGAGSLEGLNNTPFSLTRPLLFLHSGSIQLEVGRTL
jgi:hypothetical protein